MTTPQTRLLAFAISCLVAAASQAQVTEAVRTIERAKNILEFYEAAIANPQQVIVLSLEIPTRFLNSSTRYKDLSNAEAQKVGLFNSGPLGLENIELKPEPSSGHQYGRYSITLKKLKEKQCNVLSNYAAVNSNFVRVELNGGPVSANGTQQKTVAVCKSQWFFQDGKNEIKYVAY